MSRASWVVVSLLSFAANITVADVVTLTPSKDNSIFQQNTAASSGQGDLYVGEVGSNGSFTFRRGLLAFDLSSIPSGATVTNVALTITVTRSGASSDESLALHRLTSNWGEGNSFGSTGQGAPAQTNDATWTNTFFPSQNWATPGGDFASTVSATTDVSFDGTFTFASTPQLVADVQGWLGNPTSNFGWLMTGDESTPKSVHVIASRESDAASRPSLAITFTAAGPLAGDANDNGQIDRDDYALIDRGFNKHLTGFANGDFNNDGVINAADYTLIDNAFAAQAGQMPADHLAERVAAFGPSSADLFQSTVAVPEPTAALAALALLPLRRRR